MKRISFFFLFIPILFLQSCIKDDISDCKTDLLIRFRYTLNDSYADLFGSEVDQIIVYIFDSNGKYVDRFSEQGDALTNGYTMRIPLPKGEYTVIAYGGNFTTYSVGELNRQTGTLNESLQKGITSIEDFRMELKSKSDADNYLIPLNVPDDLYAGMGTNACSCTDPQQVIEIDLMKDTKKIKVNLLGTDALGAPLDVYITAANGRYKHDNSIDTDYGTFKYTPVSTTVTPNGLEINLKKLRLVFGQSPMLIIKNRTTGQILYNENMIEQIALTGKYPSQEDLDREDEFAFDISIAQNVVITTFINGWKINSITPD